MVGVRGGWVSCGFEGVHHSAKGASLPSQHLPGPFSNGPYEMSAPFVLGTFPPEFWVCLARGTSGVLQWSPKWWVGGVIVCDEIRDCLARDLRIWCRVLNVFGRFRSHSVVCAVGFVRLGIRFIWLD